MRHLNDNKAKLTLSALIVAVGYAAPAAAEEAEEAALAQTSTPTESAAPEAEPAAPAAEDQPEQIVIVGSRRVMRSVLDSPTPVDSIGASDFNAQGPTDMDRLLRSLVPSYNVSAQPISDAATLIRPANLRGLPPDSTVVLVNGKRRHRAAVISFLGAGLSDGAQGPDIGPIPALALKRVEVLRDGAAAQYGSDAIAGVMNFVLRDDPDGATVVTRVGSTYEGDGTAWSVAANVGLPLTDDGFFNFTIEYGNADPTSRSVQRSDAQGLIDAGNTDVANPAQIWGTPEISDDLKIFANMGIDVSDNVRIYAFGNVARRDVLGGFFFRNPNTRTGIYGPFIRDPNFVDEDGTLAPINGTNLLVGDLDGVGTGIQCPAVPIVNNVPDAAALAAISADTDVGRNCFVFNETIPGGFTPQFGGLVNDWSIAGGVRGVTDFGLTWDLSGVVGQNEANFTIRNTVNGSLGAETPREFNPGTYRETDQTINLDFTYPLDVGTFSPLTVAVGGEYRKETFTVVAGDTASFEEGPLAGNNNGFVLGYSDYDFETGTGTLDPNRRLTQGFGIGSNGFAGFPNDFAGSFDRENIAAYIDLTTDIVQEWTLQVAGRVESFDTFGTQGVVKASTRIALGDLFGMDFGDVLAVRGAIGTGFRAPSAGQANVQNVTTQAINNVLTNIATLPPTNPIAVARGGQEIEPETSVNVTGGIVLALSDYLSLTVDYYNIQVKDRIAQSGDQTLSQEERDSLVAQGIRAAADSELFRFFTNAFDTKTQGIDVVATSQVSFGDAGVTSFSLAYSWNETEVGDIDQGEAIVDGEVVVTDIIGDLRVRQIEDTLPNHRLVLTGIHRVGPLQVLLRGSLFGEFEDPDTDPGVVFGSEFLVDAEIGYSFFDSHFMLVAGAQNIFNTFPDEYSQGTQLGAGYQYPQLSPFGFNGGFWYFRLQAQL